MVFQVQVLSFVAPYGFAMDHPPHALIAALRAGPWGAARATVTIILEQLIVLVICLMQAVRINFNHSIIKKGIQDALGGTELGGI